MNHYTQHTLGLRKHEYYGPLLYSYIDTILKSGELLEDDFQAILSVFRVEQFHIDRKMNVPYSLIASASTLLLSIIAVKQLGSSLFMVPSSVLTTGFSCYYFFEKKKRYRHEILIEELCQALKNIQVLNKRINKYLLERKNHTNKYSYEFFQPFTNTVNDFMKILSRQQSDFQKMIITSICSFSEYCYPLKEDCMLLKDFDPRNLIRLEEDGLDNSLKYTKDIMDVQQLLNSKLLSYFAIICCFEKTSITKETLDNFMNTKIPMLIKSLLEHHKNILEIFQSLRRTVIRLSERELEKHTIRKGQISGKLRQALDTSVNNLCFVLEELYNIIDVIESPDSKADHKKIDEALKDLRGHTADTYEALDILCKLHGILSENKQHPENGLVPTSLEQLQSNDIPNSHDLSSKDRTDPSDLIEDKERYELYLKASEKLDDVQSTYEEPSDSHMRLMIKELKQNLNQHAFYVSAKKRWKDDSEEDLSDAGVSGENSSFDGEDTENEITVRENPSFTSGSVATESSVSDEIKFIPSLKGANYVREERIEERSRSSLENGTIKKEKTDDGSNSTSASQNNFPQIDTLTRTVEIEEQNNWNPILQGIKAFSQNNQLVEDTFGEDEDSD